MCEEYDILTHSLHIWVVLHNFVVLQLRVQDRSVEECLSGVRRSISDSIPDVMRDCWTHATLDVNLGHRETVICKSLHQGSIEFEQIPAAVTIHG